MVPEAPPDDLDTLDVRFGAHARLEFALYSNNVTGTRYFSQVDSVIPYRLVPPRTY